MSKKKIPIREAIEMITDPEVREKALKNLDPYYPDYREMVDGPADAINCGLDWYHEGTQGYSYWNGVYSRLLGNELELRTPEPKQEPVTPKECFLAMQAGFSANPSSYLITDYFIAAQAHKAAKAFN